MDIPLKRILLADDSPRDTELTLDALAQHNPASARHPDFKERTAMNNPVLILYLEDDPRDVELVRDKLRQTPMVCELRVARDRAEYEAALAQTRFDLILSDYKLPNYDGLAALALAREKQPDVPFILFSGTLGEDRAVDCMLRGATDYVVKQRLDRLVPAMLRALTEAEEHRKRREAEAALRAGEAKYRDLFESSRDAIMTLEPPSWSFTSGNPATVAMFGAKNEMEFTSHGPGELSPERQPDGRASAEKSKEMIATAMREGSHFFEWTHRRIGGGEFSANVLMTRMEQGGKVILQATVRDITERKRAEEELKNIHQQLVEASRRDGMVEIASNVLHNVGNVLNSVNVSTGLIVANAKKSRASSLGRVVVLLREHAQDLGTFITDDVRGKNVPFFLAHLSEELLAEQKALVSEVDSLRQNIEYIKEIVVMQQNYAKVGGVKEMINVESLVEDSIRMNEGALKRDRVEVIREFETVPPLNIEKYKILQILVNLLANSQHACSESARTDKRLTVRVANGEGRIKISVRDNGIGIPPENLTRIFTHGFTTRKDGHGFGLHSSVLAAREMGGSLTVHSDGPSQGAAFTLELPCPAREDSHG